MTAIRRAIQKVSDLHTRGQSGLESDEFTVLMAAARWYAAWSDMAGQHPQRLYSERLNEENDHPASTP